MPNLNHLEFSCQFAKQIKEKLGIDLTQEPFDFTYDFVGGSFKLEVSDKHSVIYIELPALDVRFRVPGEVYGQYQIYEISKTSLDGKQLGYWYPQTHTGHKYPRLWRELMIICVHLL